MRVDNTIARLVCGVLVTAAVTACALGDISLPNLELQYSRMPREVRLGAADMAISRVGEDVSREEVSAAVQAMVAQEAMCFPWPGLWLDASDRRNFYFARYDLMARDWGSTVAANSRQRMQEFVDLGFLTARERPDLGAGVVEYSLTEDGARYLRGSPYGGERPSFCAPSERRMIEITNMEWGQYDCGSLHVRFTHVADNWPAWARSEAARERVAATWGPVGVASEGTVTLGRQWFRRDQLPSDRSNGELRSVCYDDSRQRVVGDDLELTPAAR
jgi:hypothetical protein